MSDEEQAAGPVSDENTAENLDVQSWLAIAAGNPTLERVDFGPRYLGRRDLRDHKQRDKLLLVAPGISYESKLSHGAIPTCFRSFIANRTYVSPTELALYVRLLLLMKPDGICYEHHREISEGLFSQPKQVGPVLQRLMAKHLILMSDNDLVIPWMGRARRDILQRPSAAYTIAKLHYVGFEEEVKTSDGKRVDFSRRRYLDQTCFDRSVETLLHFYSRKGAAGAQRPPLTLLAVRQFLYENYLTDEERANSPVDSDFFNLESLPGEAARPKRGRPRTRTSKTGAH